ncbi:MAG: M1 family metallopeptidase [Chloroflexi bacterium]|nr:M1 family metallopeptidase [Chloroflexota bacterium]
MIVLRSTRSPPSASPQPQPSPSPPAGSAIVPGSVDRTSIELVATYDVDVDYDYGTRRLAVEADLTITNESGDGVDRVELNTITGPLGNLRLGAVLVEDQPVAAAVNAQTILVPLGGVLPDGATTTIHVGLRARLPRTLGGSNWLFSQAGGIVQASRWLPWIGLHRPFDRPNHGDPFFTAFSPRVVVRITTDRPLVIATPGERTAIDGLTQTFEAANVRDFPIVASPSFDVRERRVGDWTLRAFVLEGFPTSTVLDQAGHALRRMSELAGDYGYPTLVIAQTAGGYALEGPGMIWIPTGFAGETLRWNVYHEVAHQWFYGMVGSDHARDPYADEAVATHLGQVVSGIWRTTSCRERRLDLSIYRYSNACYFGQIYVHGANLLQEIRRTMGSPAYWEAIRAYVADHRWALGSTEALLDTLQDHTSIDLRQLVTSSFPNLD